MFSEVLLTQDPGGSPGWISSVILGLVEGLTEFLPVSSTGHLIVADAALGTSDPTFEIAIQVGAITAIVVLYWRRLWRAFTDLLGRRSAPGRNLFTLLVIAALPAGLLGLCFMDLILELLFSPLVVAVALIAGGFIFLLVEAKLRGDALAGRGSPLELEQMSARQALGIGLFQTLALIPGASRSGATILGGLLLGFSRTAAAEFSFLLGLPVLYGACLIKVAEDWQRVSGPLLFDLLLASLVSFVTALAIIGPFLHFLRNHSFRLFAYYRIAAGGVILLLLSQDLL